jgi:hypothetical protein
VPCNILRDAVLRTAPQDEVARMLHALEAAAWLAALKSRGDHA